MITITSFFHRNTVKDLISRWMYNAPQPSDADALGRLVHFNRAAIQRYLGAFSETIFGLFHEAPLRVRRALRKGDLKDVIVENLPHCNPRIDAMVSAYRSEPGAYYRETPFNGMLYFVDEAGVPRYVGANRIKRSRRLAEKSARRIIDRMFTDIKKRADLLAQERALHIGVSFTFLITPPSEMVEEFLKAEGRLLDDLKNGRPIEENHGLIIRDVAGLKVIVDDVRTEAFFERIAETKCCELVEKERHSGRYNASNLIVRYTPDKESLLEKPLDERTLAAMENRGMEAEKAQSEFRDFVLTAEDSVEVEVIVCNYQEMLESEIGRSMHEERILRQRLDQQYTGQLARNIEFLLEYLFAFAESGKTELAALPIRLWDRYLPDYFDLVLKALYDPPRRDENKLPPDTDGASA